ncbi:unnamed protein product [Cunninghamella blakesleeana]
MEDMSVNISEEYDMILTKLKDEKAKIKLEQQQPILTTHLAINLKHFSLKGGIHDPKCHIYFLNKYSQLTTLNLSLEYNADAYPTPEIHTRFKLALLDLITLSTSLKSLEFKIFDFKRVYADRGICYGYWPIIEFNTWLKIHPDQLTTLKHPYDIFTINENNNLEIFYEKKRNSYDTSDSIDDFNDSDNDGIKKLDFSLWYWIPQTNYLKYLKCLSIYIKRPYEIKWLYLSLGGKRKEVSSRLEELELSSKFKLRDNGDSFIIYKWLDLFPNLLKLKLIDNKYVQDVLSTRSYKVSSLTNKMYPINRLVANGKEKGERIVEDNGSYYDGMDNEKVEKDRTNKTYKLQELVLGNCELYLYYGFTSFSKKFPHLTKLTLDEVCYGIVGWQIFLSYEESACGMEVIGGRLCKQIIRSEKEKEHVVIGTTLDLSNLDLDYLYMKHFKYIPWVGNNYDKTSLIVKLNIEEEGSNGREYSLPNKLLVVWDIRKNKKNDCYTFHEDDLYNDSCASEFTLPSILNLVCKPIINLVFKKEVK